MYWIIRITVNTEHTIIVYASANSTTCFGLTGHNQVDHGYKSMYIVTWYTFVPILRPGQTIILDISTGI